MNSLQMHMYIITREPNKLHDFGTEYPEDLKAFMEKALINAINQK